MHSRRVRADTFPCRRMEVFGTVHSWPERETVIGAAKGTPGVREVQDRLRIDPSL